MNSSPVLPTSHVVYGLLLKYAFRDFMSLSTVFNQYVWNTCTYMTWSYDIPKMVPKEIAQQKISEGDVGVYGIAELNFFPAV